MRIFTRDGYPSQLSHLCHPTSTSDRACVLDGEIHAPALNWNRGLGHWVAEEGTGTGKGKAFSDPGPWLAGSLIHACGMWQSMTAWCYSVTPTPPIFRSWLFVKQKLHFFLLLCPSSRPTQLINMCSTYAWLMRRHRPDVYSGYRFSVYGRDISLLIRDDMRSYCVGTEQYGARP